MVSHRLQKICKWVGRHAHRSGLRSQPWPLPCLPPFLLCIYLSSCWNRDEQIPRVPSRLSCAHVALRSPGSGGCSPCPQKLWSVLFWLVCWSCHTGIAASRWLRCWPSTVFHDHCCLWQCPWACTLLQVKPPLWEQSTVFRVRPALFGPWQGRAEVREGHPGRPSPPAVWSQHKASEQILLGVLSLVDMQPWNSCFWQNSSSFIITFWGEVLPSFYSVTQEVLPYSKAS